MDNRWIRRARRIDCRGFREAEFPGRHGLRLSDAHAHPPHHARHARRELMVIGPSSLRATLRVQVQTISEVGAPCGNRTPRPGKLNWFSRLGLDPVEDSNPLRFHHGGLVKARLGADPGFELSENANVTKTKA
jgi:hypothetical protein